MVEDINPEIKKIQSVISTITTVLAKSKQSELLANVLYQFVDNNHYQLEEGTGRLVIFTENDFVIKLARNNNGINQNIAEISANDSSVTPQILYAPSTRIVVTPKYETLDERFNAFMKQSDQFLKTPSFINQIIGEALSQTPDWASFSLASETHLKNIIESRCTDEIKNENAQNTDICYDNIGIFKEKPILLDAGMTISSSYDDFDSDEFTVGDFLTNLKG